MSRDPVRLRFARSGLTASSLREQDDLDAAPRRVCRRINTGLHREPRVTDLGPQDMARYLSEFADGGLINIAGGCCGNTPEHIAAIAKALEGKPPRRIGTQSEVSSGQHSEIGSRA